MSSHRSKLEPEAALQEARDLILAEGQAVLSLIDTLDTGFVRALEQMLETRGRIVVTGVGKSGLVGQKISATFASTGSPSLFLHASEAIHGDLGRITGDDVVLALSNSGESEELLRLIQPIKRLGAVLIAMTGAFQSTLALESDALVRVGPLLEACPMGLVPTASTTAMMVMGDALAVCLYRARGLSREEYARYHPGGQLGRRLMKVRDVMRAGNKNPKVLLGASLKEVIAVMSGTPGRPGATSVVDSAGLLLGFFTDGDLRRLLESDHFSLETPVSDVMIHYPKSVGPDQFIDEAVQLLHAYQIDQLPVVDASGCVVGLLDVQDILGG